MNFQHRQQVRREAARLDSHARNDRALMRVMMDELRRGLSDALNRCDLLSVDFDQLDGEQLMTDLRSLFDPYEPTSAIQDAFSDGFAPTWKKRHAALDETLWNADELPSGALKE